MGAKFGRMLDILDLFTVEVTLLTAEEIASKLDISRPTAFRYARELSEAGFLANYSGRYSLGARIITLDHRIRHSDPVLGAARDIMEKLSAETGCSSVLCRMYNDEIVNVHEHLHGHNQRANFERGSSLPMFLGAASKVMLASLPATRLRKLCEKHGDDVHLRAIGEDWEEIRKYFAEIRRAGYYFSNQELQAGSVGVAAPIEVPGIGLVAAVSLLFSVGRLSLVSIDGLAEVLKVHAKEIGERFMAGGMQGGGEAELAVATKG